MPSVLVDRKKLAIALGEQFGGQRDVYDTLGYPKTIEYESYYGKYRREGIAGRVIKLPPQDTWKRPPVVKDTEGSNTSSPFTDAIKQLATKRRMWHYLERADRLARIGRYGILLVGVRDGKKLSEPLAPMSLRSPDDVLYLKPYSENYATPLTIDEDTTSERFGLPLTYRVMVNPGIEADGDTEGIEVHYSRIIHIAEYLDEDEVYGKPALEDIYNNLEDILKVVGGSSEATWKLVYKGYVVTARDGYSLPTEESETQAMSDMIDEHVHGFRRWLAFNGLDFNELGGEVVDPTGLFKIIIAIISAATDIPQRRLLGSERGELASSQDETNWNSTIAGRRTSHAEPVILRPLIDMLVRAGALPLPNNGSYQVEWPDTFEIDQIERAKLAKNVAQALSYVAPDGMIAMMVDPGKFVEQYFPELAHAVQNIDLAALMAEDDEEDEEGSDDGSDDSV